MLCDEDSKPNRKAPSDFFKSVVVNSPFQMSASGDLDPSVFATEQYMEDCEYMLLRNNEDMRNTVC
jgi:hypothetical protein